MILHHQPKTFVIALKDHRISEQQLQDCLTSAEQNKWQIEIFWGIYGNTLTDDDWHNIGVIPHIGKAGARGCFYSHYLLWTKCIELDEPVVILEHDAIINRPWESIEIEHSIIKLHKHYRKDPENQKWNHPVVGQWSPSTHAYCITPQLCKTLINAAKTIGAYPADVFMGRNIVSVQLLGEPELVERQDSYSTTETIG